jgi:hypothetical protein
MEGGDIIRWTATGCGILAAVIVSLNLGRRITGIGFLIFTVSSVTWIAAGYLEDLPSLMTQNAVLTVINILGVYRWLVFKRGQRAT